MKEVPGCEKTMDGMELEAREVEIIKEEPLA